MNFRNILSVIIGIVIAAISIFIGEHFIFPASIALYQYPEAIKSYIANAPASLHLMLLANYAVGCMIGGIVSAVIAHDKKMTKAITLGGILMGMGILNLISLSHPIWVIIVSLFAFLPFAYIGGVIGIKISSKKK